MKIRVFTLNKNNKIELTEDELKKLLDESYQDGKNDARTTTTYNLNTEASTDGTVTI